MFQCSYSESTYKVSSYSHHMSPRLSCYSVHNIFSSGKGVKPHLMRSRIPHKRSDGQCTTNLALFMVTAPPPLYNGQGRPGFFGAPTMIRTRHLLITNQLLYQMSYRGIYVLYSLTHLLST